MLFRVVFWDVTLCGLIKSDRDFEGWQLRYVLGSSGPNVVSQCCSLKMEATILRSRENCNANSSNMLARVRPGNSRSEEGIVYVVETGVAETSAGVAETLEEV